MQKGRLVIWSLASSVALVFVFALLGYIYLYPQLSDILSRQRVHLNKYLIPQGYVGWGYVNFNVAGAPAMPAEGQYYVIKLPNSAHLETSTKLDDGWQLPWNQDRYFYYQDTQLTPLNEAVSSDGNQSDLRHQSSSERAMVWAASTLMKMHRNGHLEPIRSFFVGTADQYANYLYAEDPVPDFAKIFQYPTEIDLTLNKSTNFFALASKAESLGPSHYQQAIDYYSKAIDLNENNKEKIALFYRSRARLYIRSEQYQKAVADCTAAMRGAHANDGEQNYYYRAKAWQELGQYKKAINDCDTALQLTGKLAKMEIVSVYKCRAENYARVGNMKNAISDYTDAITNTPEAKTHLLRELYTGRAQCYEKCGNEKLAKEDKAKASQLL